MADYQFANSQVNPGPTYRGSWVPSSYLQDELPLEKFGS